MESCPICHDIAEKKFRAKVNLVFGTEYDLVECAGCGVSFFDPMPTVEELNRFYSSSYYNFDRDREEGKGMAFARQLKRRSETGKFLDVGCAAGFFLNGIKKNSAWDVYGVDFGESAVRFARQKLDLNVTRGDLADAAFPDGFFDYVHVNNVLEHVLNPVSLLTECRRVLKPGGTLFLSVPNGYNDSLDLVDFWKEEQKPARSKNGHIFFFADRTLRRLFGQCRLEVETQKTYSLKRGLRSIGYLPRKSGWKRDYYPHTAPERVLSADITLPEGGRKHSDVYYRWRFVQGNLQMIPGLHKFGLDFLFILREIEGPSSR